MNIKNLAYAILDGNLTADPETKKFESGKIITAFSIAVNHYGKSEKSDGSDVSYIEVETWDKLAENCGEFLKKGKPVTVIGNIKQDRWKAPDGTNRSKFKIIANTVRFDGAMEKYSKKEEKYHYEERKAA